MKSHLLHLILYIGYIRIKRLSAHVRGGFSHQGGSRLFYTKQDFRISEKTRKDNDNERTATFPHQSLRAHRTGTALLAHARPKRGMAAARRMDRPLPGADRAPRGIGLPIRLALVDSSTGGDDCGGNRGAVRLFE